MSEEVGVGRALKVLVSKAEGVIHLDSEMLCVCVCRCVWACTYMFFCLCARLWVCVSGGHTVG